MKYTPGQGTVESEADQRGQRAHARHQGRLVRVRGCRPSRDREEHDGTITVIASSFQGRRLNRPNDVVVEVRGAIYFTDPRGNAVPDRPTSRIRASTGLC